MKRHKKQLFIWIIISLTFLPLFGGMILVKNSQDAGKSYKLIYIPKTMDPNNDFWTLLIEGVEMAAEEYNAEVTIVAPKKEEDYNRQNELIEWAIECKPDAILLSPCNYTETTPYAQKVVEAGIPLVFIDSCLNVEMGEAIVATNNVRLGEVQGSFIKQFVTENSQIAVIGHVKNSSTALEREEGVRKGLGEYEDRIVDVVFCDSNYDKAYVLMKELIEKYPDIDLVAGLNEYSAVGAARAIRDLGLTGKVKVFGTDSSLEEIQMLEEGIFEGIVIQNPFKMGYMGVEATMKALNGERILTNVDSGCELVTRENVYTEENQKLLFPFKEE